MATREENDALRTQLKGGVVLFTPGVFELPAWLRGRAIYQMSKCEKAMNEDRSEGVFIFCGMTWVWRIAEFAGERSITLSLGSEE